VTISRTDEMAEALWYCGPGQAELRQETLAPPKAGEVRVRALFGALSRGTEALVLAGRIALSPNWSERGNSIRFHSPSMQRWDVPTGMLAGMENPLFSAGRLLTWILISRLAIGVSAYRTWQKSATPRR